MWPIRQYDLSKYVNCQMVWTINVCELSEDLNCYKRTVIWYHMSDVNCHRMWIVRWCELCHRGCEQSIYENCQRMLTVRRELSADVIYQIWTVKGCHLSDIINCSCWLMQGIVIWTTKMWKAGSFSSILSQGILCTCVIAKFYFMIKFWK